MIILSRKDSQMVVDIVDAYEYEGSSLRVTKGDQECIYLDGDEILTTSVDTVPAEVKPIKYLFDGTNFSVDPDYVEPS